MTTAAPNTPVAGQFEIPGFLFTSETDSGNPAAKTTPSVTEIENDTPSETPSNTSDNAAPPATSLTTLPREELLEYIFQSTCNVSHRRWD